MPKKRPSLGYIERARELAREGKPRAARAVIRADRNKAVTRGGEDVGDKPGFRIIHFEDDRTVGEAIDDIAGLIRDRKKKKGK